jgi:hypothetical protein
MSVLNKLGEILVVPLADESFGVRSMCTYVETPDVRILVDPGVSLGPRFALAPHPNEYRALTESRGRIEEFADRAEVVTISHYHFDHVSPAYTDYVWHWSSLESARRIYQGKLVLAKDIQSRINPSQRRRGWLLRRTAGVFMKEVRSADGEVFDFGGTRLKFSEPVFHGEDAALGWVLMLSISVGDKKVMHASDVQGPIFDETLKIILGEAPDLLIVGGPPSYLSNFMVNEKTVQQGMRNLATLVENVPTVVLAHHLLRDGDWTELARPAFEVAEAAGHRLVTPAEFAGRRNNLLESRRQELYSSEPPAEAFIRWTKLPMLKRQETAPPL